MKMHRLKKLVVNRQKKGNRNIARVRQRLQDIDGTTLSDILELGCGVGAVSAFLASHYPFNVHGTDCDPDQIDRARKQHGESDSLHFDVQDATNLSFTEASFDLAIAQNTFHHIPSWQLALAEVTRILRPGGYVLWFDLVCPKVLKHLLQPLVKRVGLCTLDDITTGLTTAGLTPCFHQRLVHGPFVHHEMIWRKNAHLATASTTPIRHAGA